MQTVKCSFADCSEDVIEIKRYRVSVSWDYDSEKDTWDLGTYDTGTHFHVSCAAGHEDKMWGQQLPQKLQHVVYPESFNALDGKTGEKEGKG